VKTISTKEISMKSTAEKRSSLKTASLLVTATLVFAASSVHAKTNLVEKVEQLKINKENSAANFRQYDENRSVVEGNISEVQKALKVISDQKLSLRKQTSDAERGKTQVGDGRKKIQAWMKTEQMKLQDEKKQSDQLRKVLEKMENNQRTRESTIATYQEKLNQIDSDLNNWSAKKEEVAELEKALADKEAVARADQKSLIEKKTANEAEAAKWKRQAQTSEREYDSFSKLK
jgi:chromosome segregation ATPase